MAYNNRNNKTVNRLVPYFLHPEFISTLKMIIPDKILRLTSILPSSSNFNILLLNSFDNKANSADCVSSCPRTAGSSLVSWNVVLSSWFLAWSASSNCDKMPSILQMSTHQPDSTASVYQDHKYMYYPNWWRGTVVKRRSLDGRLSLSHNRPSADQWLLMWVNRPLEVSQLGQLSLHLSGSINE